MYPSLLPFLLFIRMCCLLCLQIVNPPPCLLFPPYSSRCHPLHGHPHPSPDFLLALPIIITFTTAQSIICALEKGIFSYSEVCCHPPQPITAYFPCELGGCMIWTCPLLWFHFPVLPCGHATFHWCMSLWPLNTFSSFPFQCHSLLYLFCLQDFD